VAAPREDDDRDAIDRAFAELVAGYYRTADRVEPPPLSAPVPAPGPELGSVPDPVDVPDEPDEVESDWYDPGPPPPLPKPAWPVLVAWLGMGYAVLAVLAVVVGVRLPTWASWLAVAGFVGAFGILVARLPRQRPPDAGDGAVL
jgi:hypothetical protein